MTMERVLILAQMELLNMRYMTEKNMKDFPTSKIYKHELERLDSEINEIHNLLIKEENK